MLKVTQTNNLLIVKAMLSQSEKLSAPDVEEFEKLLWIFILQKFTSCQKLRTKTNLVDIPRFNYSFVTIKDHVITESNFLFIALPQLFLNKKWLKLELKLWLNY